MGYKDTDDEIADQQSQCGQKISRAAAAEIMADKKKSVQEKITELRQMRLVALNYAAKIDILADPRKHRRDTIAKMKKAIAERINGHVYIQATAVLRYINTAPVPRNLDSAEKKRHTDRAREMRDLVVAIDAMLAIITAKSREIKRDENGYRVTTHNVGSGDDS